MCGGLVGGGRGGSLGSFSSSFLSFIASMLYIRFFNLLQVPPRRSESSNKSPTSTRTEFKLYGI